MPHKIDETCCKQRHCNLCDKYRKELEQYQEIGTLEEIIHSQAIALVEQVKLEKYQAIGTIEECKLAVERMKAKKPELFGEGYADGEPVYDFYRCPSCQQEYEVEFEEHNYCPNCGQVLSWEEE